LQRKTKIAGSHTVDSKPAKQEFNNTVIFPPLVFPAQAYFLADFLPEMKRRLMTQQS